MKGEVKFFNERKNYGFIDPEEGDEDLFVHRSDIEEEGLSEGDEVEFEIEQSEKGPRAVQVRKV
ncbi:MAG: cold shock domain-containing protein [Candidatus Hadarchaeia archaeon]